MDTITLKRPDGRTVQAPLKVDPNRSQDERPAPAPLDMGVLRCMLDAEDSDIIKLSDPRDRPGVWEPVVLDDDEPEVSSNMITPGAMLLVDVVPGKTLL